MKKIEKLGSIAFGHDMHAKINELCDAVNLIKDWMVQVNTDLYELGRKQTQEPERKEYECGWCSAKIPIGMSHDCEVKKEPERKEWVTITDGLGGEHSGWIKHEDEKEPECEHEWDYSQYQTMKRCYKCGVTVPMEKPSKKECDCPKPYSSMDGDCSWGGKKECDCDHCKLLDQLKPSDNGKDELSERLRKSAEINKDGYYSWWSCSQEARRWAVEVVNDVVVESKTESFEDLMDELIERLLGKK